MYIKSVIIDGFKSYGTRTEIKGFDREFNAITGLNGTGKSNILDSICFVLGISNLTHVRANCLQDLIYKSGQAGVTKASVTIVFDNSDTSKSPINYEQYDEITVTRQIVVAGKNRYMINGSTVTNKHVNDFFNSIQLNVNNPHFLIMQGRITKVLNMKPPEILSMIEEAAGTRMYENKKLGAQKTIEKKDSKIKEMNEMVAEQINPKLQRLKEERNQYMEFQKIQRDLEQLTRIYVAWQFLETEKTKQNKENLCQEKRKDVEAAELFVDKSQKQIKELEVQISDAHLKRDRESGGTLQEMETNLKESEKVEAIALAKLQSGKENLSAEVKRQKQIEKSMKDDDKALNTKRAELDKAQSVFDALRQAEKEDAEALALAQQKFQAVSSGLLTNDEGENTTLQDQLMNAKQQLTETETEVKQCMMKLKQEKSELGVKKPQLKKTEMTFAQDKKDLESKERELKSIQASLSKLNYEEGQLETLQEHLKELNTEIRRCSDVVNNFDYRYPQLSFKYKDPEPNFDKSKVRGLMCRLFTIKDKKFARALEVAAGFKLYNVVVQNEMVSSKLIERGQLTKRTTFAPLNKIQGSRMNNRVLQKAEQLVGKGNVFLAQTLVDYSPEYEVVMSWSFGHILICTSIDAAETIATHSEVRKKAITLDGDVFDPNGVISGGAAEKQQPILLALMDVVQAEKNLNEKTIELNSINRKINALAPIANNYDSLKQKYDLRNREVEMVRTRLQQTSHYQLQQEIESLEESINTKEARIKECQGEIKTKSTKVSELEYKLKNLKEIREKELSKAEQDLKRIKKKSEESRNKWKLREQEFETLNLEIKELEQSVQNGKEQLLKSQEMIVSHEKEVQDLKVEVEKVQETVKELKVQVKTQKEAIGQKNKEIQQMVTEKEKLTKQISEKQLDCISLKHNITNLQKDVAESEHMLHAMSKKYKWINDDKEYFGQPNGMYDFKVNDPKVAEEKINKLKEAKEKLGKHVNTKALDLLSSQEEQFKEVMTKKSIVEDDRSKILSVIEELDIKKEDVIRKAWDKVNHDFNSILSSLLPSAHACLKPVDGKGFMDGLQVKVGFGGIWKDSLDELSGGQRSLVALSLILAMLLFKPAPLYILDEVDAALDPSHTQNIGQMLKAHFKQSQFIIVSLKEGMFNNANVLFRTSFVDGMSAVLRTTASGR